MTLMHDLVSVKVVMAQRRRPTEGQCTLLLGWGEWGASHGGESVVLHVQSRLLQYLRSALNAIMCMLQAWRASHAMTRTMCMMSSRATWWPATSWCLPALSHRCAFRSRPLRYVSMVLLQCTSLNSIDRAALCQSTLQLGNMSQFEGVCCTWQAGEAYSIPAMLIL